MRGGKRQGAGRPRKEGERIPFRCELPKDAADILRRLSKEAGQTRTAYLAMVLRKWAALIQAHQTADSATKIIDEIRGYLLRNTEK